MAQPSHENGYTRFINELLEVICSTNFTQRELKIILVVMRYTEGFHREEAELSARFIANATGIKYQHVAASLRELYQKKVLSFSEGKTKTGRVIKFNKDYKQWETGSNQNSDCAQIEHSAQISYEGVPETVTEIVPKTVTKKDINKYNLNIYDTHKQNFINEVKEQKQYDPEILNSFIDYWTEPNKSKTKMRFEYERTFDIGRRLKMWERNAQRWNKGSTDDPNKKFRQLRLA